MPQIKLEEPGDEHTMKVAEVVYDTDGQFPVMFFYGEDGDFIKMSGKTGQDKLKRLNWTVQSVNEIAQSEALWLKFSRAENPTPGQSPYWNVALAEKRAQKAQSTRQAPPPSGTADRAAQRQPAGKTGHSGSTPAPIKQPIGPVYLECLEFVLDHVVPRWIAVQRSEGVETFGPIAIADIASATATLFIRSEKQPGALMPKSVQSRRSAEPPPPSDEDYPSDYDDEPGDR